MSLFFRCLNPPTMASHLRALLMLLWWVYILLYIPRLLNEILILSLRMELIETQVLYEECNQVKSKSRSQQISAFISTFQVGNLRFAQTRLKHWLQLKDLCLNLQNVVHTFAKLRVNIGDFKVISAFLHFVTHMLVIERVLVQIDKFRWFEWLAEVILLMSSLQGRGALER